MLMKLTLTITIILLLASSLSVSAANKGPAVGTLGLVFVGVNVLTSSFNGIYAYNDPPQYGPIFLGIGFGVVSGLLGSALIAATYRKEDTEYFALGGLMVASGIAAITFAFINSDRVSNSLRESSVTPELSFNLRGGQVFRLGIGLDF